jgi:hypothetical protein
VGNQEPRQCPVIPLEKESWREGKAMGNIFYYVLRKGVRAGDLLLSIRIKFSSVIYPRREDPSQPPL